MTARELARMDELSEGALRVVHVEGRRIVLVRLGEQVAAYEDRCVHLGVPLSAGRLDGRVLTCGAHHWQYDVTTGRGINPRSAQLERVAVEVADGVVRLAPEASS